MKLLEAEVKIEERGSITVFLSLILLLLFAMCAALIEGARIHTGRQREQLILESAVDAEFTKYCFFLYENYHVFFLNRGIDTNALTGEDFLNSIQEYIFSGLENKAGEWQAEGKDLYKDELVSLELKGVKTPVEEQGEIFRNEVLEYMKYKAPGSSIETILEKMDLFSAAQKTGKVLRHKLAAEEAMGELDQLLLDEIRYIDGVIFKKNGTLGAESSFGKKYTVNGMEMNEVGINNSIIYSVMLPEYINPVEVLSGLENKAEKLIELISEKEELELALLSGGEETSSGNNPSAGIKKKLRKLKSQIKSLLKEMKEDKKRLTSPLPGMALSLQNARENLPLLEEKQKEIIERLKEYENSLNEQKEEIPGDAYNSLLEDLREKQEYAGKNDRIELSIIEKALNMEPRLMENQLILESFMGYDEVDFEDEIESLKAFIRETEKYKALIMPYDIKSLTFDYSGVMPAQKIDSPLEAMQDFLNEGIMALVIPDNVRVSDYSLLSEDRLYKAYGENPLEQKEPAAMKDSLKGVDKNGYNSGITDSAEQFGEEAEYTGTSEGEKTGSKKPQEILENVLLNQYAAEHTVHFLDSRENSTDDKAENKEESRSGLSYEMEYLIQGKAGDRENLQGVINRILFIRTMLNFIAVLTDSEKRSKAYTTANALVGFTGMKPLVVVTQTLILIAWAYEEGVVDTAAMLLGKPIPILKAPSDFQMQYSDLLRISPGLVRQKAGSMPDTALGLCINYEEFLFINLLTIPREVRCYRIMDLADACGKRYQEGFAMENCVFSAEIEAVFSMPAVFSQFRYLRDVVNEAGLSSQAYENRCLCFHSY